MKAKPGFKLHKICGENIIVAEGRENIDFTYIINMNDTSAYLWNAVEGKDFDDKALAKLLTDEYEVDYDTALADANTLIQQWIKAGIVK